ncbi:oxygen-dependent choline dehydrogenase-like [Mya arenaria]|uniref:oxygen-dependent choline dehydrogenase-like n=1 Tax=Mya arenaria TaxID=6604 RepID=UPI0022E89DE5|nr:oxygen-dependent choline dehydrogenase-like [Mya arenaria]
MATQVTGNLLQEYDFIIVGAGSAGSVLAARLSEDAGNTVLLVEAGGDDAKDRMVSTPIMYGALQRTPTRDWAFVSEPQKHSMFACKEHRLFYPRGKILGGSSSINAMLYVRGSRHDFDSWEERGCTGWSYRDVLPYFLKSEKFVDINNGDTYVEKAYHNTDGPQPVTRRTITSLTRLMSSAAEELGYKTIDYNGKDMIGVSPVYTNITENGLRASSSRCFLRPAMSRPNLHIAINTSVRKVLLDGDRAVGVEAVKDGRTMEVRARKEVVLCAGAIMTPHILLCSGIGPRWHLEEANIPVMADLPVGENLQDHLNVLLSSPSTCSDFFTRSQLFYPTNILKYLWSGKGWWGISPVTDLGFFRLGTDTRPGQPDIQFHVVPLSIEGSDKERHQQQYNVKDEIFDYYQAQVKHFRGRQAFTICVTLLHPRSSGTVRLDVTDPHGHPRIDPNYLHKQEDVDLYIKGIREAQRFLDTKAMQAVGAESRNPERAFPPSMREHAYDTDGYWESFIRHFTQTVYHPTSTCKMGAVDDSTAVVDPMLRVKGYTNLRVADASIMPEVISGNTNAASVMIGEKAADMIRGVDTVKRYRKPELSKL